ncbi:MAG: site-specific DNA-methyltransferase [Anaerolineae bacterium]
MNDWRIETGDALRLIPSLDSGAVNLVVTSPPYPGQMGNGQTVEEWLEWLDAITAALLPRLAPAAVVVLDVTFKRTGAGWFDTRLFTAVPDILEAAGLRCHDTYIWHKTNGAQNGPLAYADAPGYEVVYAYTNADRPGDVTFNPQRKPYATKSISSSGAARIGYGRTKEPNGDGARQTNVLSLATHASDGQRPRARGVSFPLELPRRFIAQYTRPGDLVLDFCAGVGTTGRMAVELGRRFIGFEIDPAEAEQARQWIAGAPARLLPVTE